MDPSQPDSNSGSPSNQSTSFGNQSTSFGNQSTSFGNQSTSYGEQSPYAPPLSTSVASEPQSGIREYAAPYPFRLTLFATCLATVVLGSVFIFGMNNELGGLIVFILPFVCVGVFVGVCMKHFQAGGAAARSAGWKVLMVTLIPLTSVILFVPTCFGTGLGVFVVLSGTRGLAIGNSPVIMFIPLFAGFLVTFSIIALRLRYLMPKSTAEPSGKWNEVVPTGKDFTIQD